MKLLENYRKKKKADEKYFTPDFQVMLRVVFWNSLGFFFFGYIIPQVTNSIIGADEVALGYVFSAQIFGALLSSPLAGWLTDKLKEKKLLVLIGSFGRAISYVILYFGTIFRNLYTFIAGAFVLGFTVALYWPPFDSLMSQKSYKTKRSYAFGRRFGLMGLGNLVGSVISIVIFATVRKYLPENLALQYSPLLIFFAANIYAGVMFYRKVDESSTIDDVMKNGVVTNPEIKALKNVVPSDDKDSIKGKLSKALLTAFIVFGITVLFSAVNQTIADPFTQIYVKTNIIKDDLLQVLINDDDVYVMLIYFPGPVLGLLLSPALGRICDKIRATRGLPVIAVLGAVFTLILINLNTGWSFGILLLIDMTFALSGNLIFQNFLSRISKEHRGKIFGMLAWVSRIGATIGPIIGGYAFRINDKLPFTISIFVELALIIPFLISIKLLQPHLVEKIEILGD
ncbi:MAG: MFS transporter [Promethearchaeota archaeon]